MAKKAAKKTGKRAAKRTPKRATKASRAAVANHPAADITFGQAMHELGALKTAKAFVKAAYEALFGETPHETAVKAAPKTGKASKGRPSMSIGAVLRKNGSASDAQILADAKVKAYMKKNGINKAEMAVEVEKYRATH